MTPSPAVLASPVVIATPGASLPASGPCRLLAVEEVNSGLGGGYLAGVAQDLACVFQGDPKASNAGLLSVAVVNGDVIGPIKVRYPDLQDVPVSTGKASWSASVATLWLVLDGPKTVMVSVPGSTLATEQLLTVALQLAQLAAGRI